jgi:hypothetical protein
MKTYLRGQKGRLGFEAGWFPGETFRLFMLSIWDVAEDYPPPNFTIFPFRIQVARLMATAWIDCGKRYEGEP